MSRSSKIWTLVLVIAAIAVASPVDAARRRAKPKKAAPSLEQTLAEAQKAFDEYRFADAAAKLDLYDELAEDTKKGTVIVDTRDLRRRTDLGISMLDRVEKIAVIDSVTLPLTDFLKAYRLSAPAGSIVAAEALAPSFGAKEGTTAYVSESGDMMIWSATRPDSATTLRTSSRLIDGAWETPADIDVGVDNAAYPFLMPDGLTLYFAATGDESLGGYDIFLTRRDNGDTFMQPRNVGMPYNSTANDYLLAIDELTGAGWWATDRSAPEGMVTVYMFVPQDMRINYPVETPDLADRARVTSIAATQEPGKDYSAVRSAVAAVHQQHTPGRKTDASGVSLQLPDGRIITSASQLRSQRAAALFADYADAAGELTMMRRDLADLRERYGSGDRSTEAEILQLENECARARQSLRSRANAVIAEETRR